MSASADGTVVLAGWGDLVRLYDAVERGSNRSRKVAEGTLLRVVAE